MSDFAWTRLSEENLLQVRICDLGLRLEDTDLQDRVQELYGELENKGLSLRPRVYLGDEWFSPEGVPAIAIPFYLAHPRLMELENKFMLEVEGGTPDWCLRLLRHETGHCFDHAYQVSKKRKWRQIFGSPNEEYDPDNYRPRPYSQNFVRHLDNWYAQAHPDEDFAETFAVWLNPTSDWKKTYSRWKGALRKLEYIEELASKAKGEVPMASNSALSYSASRMKTTLGRYYQRRRREHADHYPDFYDRDLRSLFSGEPDLSKREYDAARFLKRNRKEIVNVVGRWSGAKKYTINSLLKELTLRCEEIGLRLGKSEDETRSAVVAYLSVSVTTYLFTGKFKRSV